jgi:hypothetical protein
VRIAQSDPGGAAVTLWLLPPLWLWLRAIARIGELSAALPKVKQVPKQWRGVAHNSDGKLAALQAAGAGVVAAGALWSLCTRGSCRAAAAGAVAAWPWLCRGRGCSGCCDHCPGCPATFHPPPTAASSTAAALTRPAVIKRGRPCVTGKATISIYSYTHPN